MMVGGGTIVYNYTTAFVATISSYESLYGQYCRLATTMVIVCVVQI